MKIDAIKPYSLKNNTRLNLTRSVSFGIGRSTSSGIETQEEKENLEISCTMGDIGNAVKYAKKCGKKFHKIGNILLKAGKKVDYQNYKINYDKKANLKVVYGEKDKKTGYPSSISIVTCSDMLETIRKYNISSRLDDPFSSYTITEEGKNTSYNWVMQGEKVVSYSKQRNGSKIVEEYFPIKGGFSYKETRINDDGSKEEIASLKYCDDKKDPVFDYIRTQARTKKQPVGHFVYNQRTKMWKRQDKLNVEG